MENTRAIVITGTSAGIGKACDLHLDKSGFKVYAGVRKLADGDKLKNEASEHKKGIFHLSVYTLSRQGHNIYRKKPAKAPSPVGTIYKV